MSDKNIGGYVFPDSAEYGMSLRDYFAAKAMTMKFGNSGTHIDLSDMAKKCYAMADAMILEREK